MGKSMPPYYYDEGVEKLLETVNNDDEQINELIIKLNELFIKRAEDVKAFNEAVAKIHKNQD